MLIGLSVKWFYRQKTVYLFIDFFLDEEPLRGENVLELHSTPFLDISREEARQKWVLLLCIIERPVIYRRAKFAERYTLPTSCSLPYLHGDERICFAEGVGFCKTPRPIHRNNVAASQAISNWRLRATSSRTSFSTAGRGVDRRLRYGAGQGKLCA